MGWDGVDVSGDSSEEWGIVWHRGLGTELEAAAIIPGQELLGAGWVWACRCRRRANI